MNLDIQIIYSKRKTLTLAVDSKGTVTLKAPVGTKKEMIQSFIESKRKWIEEKTQKNKTTANRFKKIADAASLLYLGVEHTIIVLGDKPSKIKDGQFVIPLKYASDDLRKKQCENFLKRNAKKYLEQRLGYIASHTNLKYSDFKIINSRSRWGVCKINTTGKKPIVITSSEIGLNWRLMMCPPLIIDYVALHELAHLKYMDHSAEFWKLVESFMPNFRDVRKALKDVNILNTLFRQGKNTDEIIED